MITATLPSLSDALRAQIEEHVFSETEQEVGGILVGRLADGQATVEAAIPALRAAAGTMNVTFTHEVWSDVLQIVERDHPGQRIVGWYHSHPGFGIFLSEYDTFIQANFFSQPGMLALVVDPLAAELGWFGWRDGEVTELGRTATLRLPAPRASDESHVRRVRRGNTSRVVGGGLVLAGLAGVAGYAFGNLNAPAVTVADQQAQQAPAPESPPEVADLEAQLADAQKEVAELLAMDTVSIAYTVQPGDSWWSIADTLLGDAWSYPEVQDANPEEPGLDPGDVIVVPDVPVAPR